MIPKVLLGYSTAGTVVAQFCDSVAGLIMHKTDKYELIGVMREWGAYIPANRNKIVDAFLATDADWLFMVDCDEEFKAVVVDMLLEWAPAYKIISGWTKWPRRENGKVIFDTMVFQLNPESRLYKTIPIPEDGVAIHNVDAVGAGSLIIHRDVFLSFDRKDAWPWFDHEKSPGNEPYGEDVTFCRRATALGWKIVVDCKARFIHHKLLGI
jgi:hypothetical protein